MGTLDALYLEIRLTPQTLHSRALSGTQLVNQLLMGMQKPTFYQIIADMKKEYRSHLPPLKQVREKYLKEVERVYLAELMRQSGGNVKKASKTFGISLSRLYALLKKHALSRHQ